MTTSLNSANPASGAAINRLKDALALAVQPTRHNVGLWIISSAALLILAAMSAVLTNTRVSDWEADLTRTIQGIDYPGWAFQLTADRLTNADTIEGATVISLIAAALWLAGLKVEGALVIFSVALHALGNTPKLLVERTPPLPADGVTWPEGMSFPSGHAEFAITFYGFLAYLLVVRLNGTLSRGLLVSGWLVAVVVVGFARIDSGDHWPLDVLGGYVAGIGLLSLLVWLHRSLSRAFCGAPQETERSITRPGDSSPARQPTRS
jgi:membrane-associated phospholipid phosphatase